VVAVNINNSHRFIE